MKILNYSQLCFKSLICVFILLPFVLMAETIEVNDKFWVVAQNEAAYKAEESFTNNPELNFLLEEYNVFRYEQAFPFAKNEQLQHVYEIECDCNIDNLISELENSFSEFYFR